MTSQPHARWRNYFHDMDLRRSNCCPRPVAAPVQCESRRGQPQDTHHRQTALRCVECRRAWSATSRRMSTERFGVRIRVRAASTAVFTVVETRVREPSAWPSRVPRTLSTTL